MYNVYRSVDMGRTWTGVFTTSSVADLEASAREPGVLYGANDESGQPTFLRHDAGLATYHPTFDGGRGLAAAVDPSRSGAWYLGGEAEGAAAVFATVDSGGSWTRIGGEELGRAVLDLAVYPAGGGPVLAATDLGVFADPAGRGSWRRVLPGGFRRLAFALGTAPEVFAAGSGGVFRSRDAGSSWDDLTAGLPDRPTAEVAAAAGIAYAATEAHGLWRLRTDGASLLYAPSRLTGTKREARSLFQVRAIAELRWETDPRNAAGVRCRVYRLDDAGAAVPIADVAAGATSYLDREARAGREDFYLVRTMDASGREGGGAWVAAR